jgi:hypothetical protein
MDNLNNNLNGLIDTIFIAVYANLLDCMEEDPC